MQFRQIVWTHKGNSEFQRKRVIYQNKKVKFENENKYDDDDRDKDDNNKNIFFTHMHSFPSSIIIYDLTIHKYKIITGEERSATDVCSQMFTIFRFSSEQVLLIHQSSFLLPPFGYRPQTEC